MMTLATRRQVWITSLPHLSTMTAYTKLCSVIFQFRNCKKLRPRWGGHFPSWVISSFTRTRARCRTFPIRFWVDLHHVWKNSGCRAFHLWDYHLYFLLPVPSNRFTFATF